MTKKDDQQLWERFADAWRAGMNQMLKEAEQRKEARADQLKVVICEPNKTPEITDIKHDNESMREIVGGWLETVFFDSPYLIVCNEEGHRLELPLNRYLGDMPILGTFFITKVDPATGDFVDLNEEEADLFKAVFSARMIILG